METVQVQHLQKARLFFSFFPVSELAIPVRWTAPEGYHGKHCLESDVWAFGVLIWEVFTNGKMPYHDLKTSIEVVNKVRPGSIWHYTTRPVPFSDI